MVDMGAISGIAASLNAATNIMKAMVDLRDWSTVQSKVIELQGAILGAQTNLFAANDERSSLIEEVSRLKREIASFEKWGTEQEKYKLVEIGSSCFAYLNKKERRGSEPAHYICQRCYEDRKKSILHFKPTNVFDVVNCSSCGAEMKMEMRSFIPPEKQQ